MMQTVCGGLKIKDMVRGVAISNQWTGIWNGVSTVQTGVIV